MYHHTHITSPLWRAGSLWLAALLLVSSACSDDTQKSNNTTTNNTPGCPVGQRYNPILGQCEGGAKDMTSDMKVNPRDMKTSSDMTTPGDMPPDMVTPPDMPIDMNVDNRCKAGIDSDNDGLDNDCECSFGLDPFKADTDGDGLTDGEEDADKSCSITRGSTETDPRRADTDGDGINDGDEKAAGLNPLKSDSDADGISDGVERGSCTDPLDPDTDKDGLEDGVEDANQDGLLGTCPNRVFDVMCAGVESDPCKADTDGDGTPDNDEVQYRQCREEDKQNLVQPELILGMGGDYQLAAQPGTISAALSSATGSPKAHVFEDPTHHYTGFVISLTPPNGTLDSGVLSDHVFGQITSITDYAAATRRSAGRRITTHDSFKATVNATVDLPATVAPQVARDKLLAQLTGLNDLTHGLSGTITPDAAEPTLFIYEVISRSATDYILVGAFVPYSKWQDPMLATGWRVDDLIGGTSVAKAIETLEADCVSYKVIRRPKVDIIISIDASGSISDERAQLSGFATNLVTFLNNANLDWRIGVTSVGCAGIGTDMALPADFRMLFPATGGFPPTGVCPGFGGGGTGTTNGRLIGNDFTTDPAAISNRIDTANTTASEYSVTMGAAAVARALPRTLNAADKLRPEAAVIVIVVTDEEDEYFKTKLQFLPKETLTPAERMQMEMSTQPFVDYLLRPDIGATVFGLYFVPGDPCMTAQPASGVHDIIVKTGGNGGSICQADITTTLQTIASATAGIASGLRLRGAPVSPSIKVLRGDVATGNISPLVRSRSDGFDYDGVVNRVAFYGPNPPQTNDIAVIPYLRWKNSLIQCNSTKDCPQEQKLQCLNNVCL